MVSTEPFDANPQRYERWYEKHTEVYRSELAAVEKLMPENFGKALEVGVGTGRFAAELGIDFGVEPSSPMAQIARNRGIEVVDGRAGDLPLSDRSFDLYLSVTVLAFVEDLEETFVEANRVLQPEGTLVVGFIPAESEVGRSYRERQEDNEFFAAAEFQSTDRVLNSIKSAGFGSLRTVQTLTRGLAETSLEAPKEGHQDGSFVVVRAHKPA